MHEAFQVRVRVLTELPTAAGEDSPAPTSRNPGTTLLSPVNSQTFERQLGVAVFSH